MDLPDPSTFIARGASAEVFRLKGRRVFKLFHAGIEPVIVAREVDIAGAVQATGLPVPRMLGQGQAGGRDGIIYQEVRGPNLLAHIRRHPTRFAQALDQMAALHARIHGEAVPALRSRKTILAEDIEAADLDADLCAAALDRLDHLVEGDRLSHGDLHPANLIVTSAGLVVIDWSKAARAAPAADVVRTEMLLRFGPGPTEGRGAGAMRDMAAAYYLRRYRRRVGMEAQALAAWRPLVALAWLRHRLPGRDEAFARYLDEALATAGLPPRRG